MQTGRTKKRIQLCVAALLCVPLPIAAHAQSSAPEDTEAFRELSARAIAARDAERIDEARELLHKAVAMNPQWAEGWWSLGTIDYDNNDFRTAATDLQHLVPLQPENGTAHILLGLSEYELGNWNEALQHLEKGRALGVTGDAQLQAVALYHEGLLHLRAGRYKLAQAAFAPVCKVNGDSGQLLSAMAAAVLRVQQAQSALEDVTTMREVGQAACLVAMKRFDDAKLAYARLLQAHPGIDNLHYAAGLALLEGNDLPGALEQFQAQIAARPDNLPARLEMAQALYKVDSKRALPFARQAVALAPKQPFAHYLLGLILLDTGQDAEAIPELQIAAKAFPEEKRIYFALGSALARVGQPEKAAEARAQFERLSKSSAGQEASY